MAISSYCDRSGEIKGDGVPAFSGSDRHRFLEVLSSNGNGR
ncbi:hypothetical protein [Nostoc sp.]